MDTLEITLQRKLGRTWPVVVEYSVPDSFLPVRREGTFAFDPVVLQSQPTAKEYGTVLGKALFQGEVRDSFTRAVALSDHLRILLFLEANDLRTLRWERLCVPLDGMWDFLALNARAPFSLYLPSLTDRRFPPIGRRDLRALIVAASPNGLADYRLEPFDVTTAVGGIKAALGEIPCHVLASVDSAAGPPTLDALCERITAGHYTLLHIVCHGRYQRSSGQSVLFLADVWEVEDALYYLEQIPIVPQGPEHWYYDDFDNYREPLALLLHVEHRQELDDGSDTLREAYPDHDFPAGLDLGTVAAGLRHLALPEPLSGLTEAMALVQCDCGNPWMDYSASDLAEMGTDLPWDDPETVAWLTETWQEARPRLERVCALVDWCSPQAVGPPDGERLDAVVDLLLQAYRMEKRDG